MEKDPVDRYKKLAGSTIDTAAIERLKLARLRSRNVLLKQWQNINEYALFLATSKDVTVKPTLPVATPVLQPRCSPDFNASSPDSEIQNYQALWFYNNFVIDEETSLQKAYDYRLSTPSTSIPIRTFDNMEFDMKL